jgi:dipeptidyl aminopeptidase/acylaminoacyl peptidase
MRNLIAILVFSLLPPVAGAQSKPHPLAFEDAATLHHADIIAVSPDGKTLLYRVRYGGTKGPDNVEWKLIPATGGDSRTLTVPDKFTPSGFTRDGSALYGTYDINKRAQLATLQLASANTPAAAAAAPVPLTALPRGIHSALISPDGSHYALLGDPRLPDPLEDVHTVIEADPTSMYIIKADGSGGAWWCPTLRDIAEEGIVWSADGASLAVLSQTPKIGFHDVRSFIDVCSAAGAHHIATIDNAASNIAFMNSGKDLAFLSTTSPVLTPDHVWTVPIAGGSPVDRTPELSASAIHLSSDADGDVWVTVARGVQTEVDLFQNNSLVTTYTWPDGAVEGGPVSPQIAHSPKVRAFTVSDPRHTANVAVARENKLEKVTNESDDQLAKIVLGEVRAVHWTSQDGIALEGIVTFPADYHKDRRYPFIVLPHGGPESNDLLVFDMFTQWFAGLGYMVLQPEYRGSTGYGTDFLSAIYQHFGDRAYRDVDSATDYAIAQSWADPGRLTMFGWSAGGFMTAWTVTQTHRYRAAIEGAGITDWLSFMWTSDVQQTDYDARWPDKDPEAFTVFSAVMYSDSVVTPLLILHGAADQRVPTYQGRELFEVLAARGKTTRMVTYPGSPHFPTLWEQRQDVFREIAAWLARYNP